MQDQTLGNSKVNREVVGRPWWKTSLIVAIVIIVVFFLVSTIIVGFFGGSGPRVVKQLPDSFPTNFVVYRMGLVKQITYYSASEKNKPLRLVMAPVKAVANMVSRGSSVSESMDRFLGAVRGSETITMTWEDVDANADDILAFYANSIRAAGATDPQMRQTEEKDVSQIVGVTNTGAKINVLLVDDKNTPSIDSITLIVEYVQQEK